MKKKKKKLVFKSTRILRRKTHLLIVKTKHNFDARNN